MQPHSVERAGWCCSCPGSDTQARWGSVTHMVLVSSASGPRVSGCTRAPLNFRPSPVYRIFARATQLARSPSVRHARVM